MKTVTPFARTAALLLLALTASCSKSEEPSADELIAHELMGTWKTYYSQEITFEDGTRNEHEKYFYNDSDYSTLEFKEHAVVTRMEYSQGNLIATDSAHFETHLNTLAIHWQHEYTETDIFSTNGDELDLKAVDHENPNGDEFTVAYLKQ